jgi:hypothetical protein
VQAEARSEIGSRASRHVENAFIRISTSSQMAFSQLTSLRIERAPFLSPSVDQNAQTDRSRLVQIDGDRVRAHLNEG